MKKSKLCLWLIPLSGVLGMGGLALRIFYFKTAVDAGGYLLSRQPVQIAYWVLAAVMTLAALILSRGEKKLSSRSPANPTGGIAQILLAVSLAVNTLMMSRTIGFSFLLRILGGAAALLLLADGIARCFHKSLGMTANSAFCIFLLLYAVGSYTQWRSIPEMERFLVPAIATLLLLPLSCEMAAWDNGCASGRWLTASCALTCFFSLSALGCPGAGAIHAGGAIWSMLTFFNLRKEGAEK